jgi:hypothetical protein
LTLDPSRHQTSQLTLANVPTLEEKKEKGKKRKEKEGREIARDRPGSMNPRRWIMKPEVTILQRAEGRHSRFY